MIQKMRKRLGCKKGFTLIELIVVIAILGILAMLAIPQVTGLQERAREEADIANAKTIANQVAILFAQDKLVAATYDDVADDTDLSAALRGAWPKAQAAAAKKSGAVQPITCVLTDAGVITITVNEIQLYPTPAGAYTE